MIKPRLLASIAMALASQAMPALAQPPAPDRADYLFVGDIALGAPNFWDYLTYDAGGKRLYAAHVHKISVIDIPTGRIIGEVGPLGDAHGVAIDPKRGKGYADSGEEGVLKVFRLSDLMVTQEIKVSPDADGVVYDPHTDRVLVVAGDSKTLTIVDPETDVVATTVALPGKPEFLAVDQRGFAYVNLADVNAIAKVDLAAGMVVKTWPLDNCRAPHGLGYDQRMDRLFSGCANGRLVVVDAATGANLANLPIGALSDAIAVDPARGRVFSANGDGTLTVISETGGAYRVVRTIPTFFGGRNMAIDPETGRLFVSHGHTVLAGPMTDPLALKFAWDGLNVAMFDPND